MILKTIDSKKTIFGGLEVHYNSQFNSPASIAYNNKTHKPIILINKDLFNKFSASSQKVILYHEYGHYRNHNKDDKNDLISEFRADGFAAIYLGKNIVIEALKETFDMASTQKSKEHILSRINNLKG